jgi:hypothetical protein
VLVEYKFVMLGCAERDAQETSRALHAPVDISLRAEREPCHRCDRSVEEIDAMVVGRTYRYGCDARWKGVHAHLNGLLLQRIQIRRLEVKTDRLRAAHLGRRIQIMMLSCSFVFRYPF